MIVLAMKPAALERGRRGDPRDRSRERGTAGRLDPRRDQIAAIEQAFGPGTPVLRFMPNVAAEVRAGTFCYAPGTALDDAHRARACSTCSGCSASWCRSRSG